MPILVTCECGKQFQAKDENVGRRFNCPNCDREVVVPKPEYDPYANSPNYGAPRPEAKTSGNAIASLILGILSLVGCLFFTGIPAIICGAISLSSIGKSNGRMQGKGMAIAGLTTGIIGSVIMIPVMLALLLPAVQAAREAARRTQCVNNLKQIGLAMHNYASAYGHFPPAASVDADGKPLLSWRVAILPFIEEQALFEQFKQDEPWDGPNNSKLIARMPNVYRCPSDPVVPGTSTTHYEGITGPSSIFDGPDGIGFDKITDGTSNTMAVVEAKAPVDWTKPDDVPIAGVATAVGSRHPGGANVLFADGSVRFLKTITPAAIIRALAGRDDGVLISPGSY
jgi:prepilin-type processing-associated H-X9-DG protein